MRDGYRSATYDALGNQAFFTNRDKDEIKTGRVSVRLETAGTHMYRLMYSDVIDSTYADGSESFAGMYCGGYTIHGVRCGVYAGGTDIKTCAAPEIRALFGGSVSKTLCPGETCFTDPFALTCEAGDDLVIEIDFSGERVPFFPEIIVNTCLKGSGGWREGLHMPVPGCVGCDAPYEYSVAFMGDSITEGIGTPEGKHAHWVGEIGRLLGPQTDVWDVGLGYGRAQDAARGHWQYKASRSPFVNVCFGVNDILQEKGGELENNLVCTVRGLKAYGCRVGMFTVPPFDYDAKHRLIWERVNSFIRTELAREVEYVFDTVPVLGSGEGREHIARYGGHPDETGSKALAVAYVRFIRENGIRF